MYTLTFRVAHDIGDDPLFIVECDGHDITGIMNAPFTGGMSKWVTLNRPAVQLPAGKHVFTVKQVGGTSFYLDSIDFASGGTVKPGPTLDARKWKLVWSDEFNYTGKPDPEKWAYDIGGDGWGNHELEYYTDRLENARVENGKLIIEARREDFRENHYTSARLVTRGRKDFTYGRIEVSAKLPAGAGTWPAIWMLGENGKPWPACGELDIMEHLGRNSGWIHGSAHTLKYFFKNGNQRTSITYVPQPDSAFHKYAIEWYPDHLDMFVDNNKFFTVVNDGSGWEAWPFDHPEYLIMNLALGGWGGTVDESKLPAKMEVEYVRVYQQNAK
jgi:beta-glucanase (GH16 family)